MQSFRARTVQVRSDFPMMVHGDSRPLGTTPARFEVLPSVANQAAASERISRSPSDLGIHVKGGLGMNRVQPLSAITQLPARPGDNTPGDHGQLRAGIMPGLVGQPQNIGGHEQGNGAPSLV